MEKHIYKITIARDAFKTEEWTGIPAFQIYVDGRYHSTCDNIADATARKNHLEEGQRSQRDSDG